MSTSIPHAYDHVWDESFQQYKCLRFEYANSEWFFDHWMPADWRPASTPQPVIQQTGIEDYDAGPKTPNRTDSVYAFSSPAGPGTLSQNATSSYASPSRASPAGRPIHSSSPYPPSNFHMTSGHPIQHAPPPRSQTSTTPRMYTHSGSTGYQLSTASTPTLTHPVNHNTGKTPAPAYEYRQTPVYPPAERPGSNDSQFTAGSQQRRYSNQGRSMPKGEGKIVLGTYSGPPTLHYEELDQSYYVRSKAFFFEGRVFSIISSESAGENSRKQGPTDYTTSSSVNEVRFKGNFVFTNVRRFVVVRQRREFCYACPIFTYSGRATTKTGVRANEHGIVYSWGGQPQLLRGEGGITKPSLSVVMTAGVPHLHKASRVYYGIHHPIQYNVKVKDIGYVPKDQVPVLIGSWRAEDDKDTEQASYVTNNAHIPELPELDENENYEDENYDNDLPQQPNYQEFGEVEELANDFTRTTLDS